MDSKYGRSTLAKIELDIPKLHSIKDQLQELADHFKAEAEQVDIMIVTLEKRVTVMREEDRLDTDRRRYGQEEDRSVEHPFRGRATQYPTGTTPTQPPAGSTTKPTNPDTGTGSVSPTTPPPPAGQEHGTAEAQAGTPEAQPLDMEHSSGNDPTTEEETPRNKA